MFISSTFVRNKSVNFLQDVPLGDHHDCVGTAKVSLSTNWNLSKQLWLFKRELKNDDVGIADVINILSAFDLGVMLYRFPVLPQLRSTTLPVSMEALTMFLNKCINLLNTFQNNVRHHKDDASHSLRERAEQGPPADACNEERFQMSSVAPKVCPHGKTIVQNVCCFH